MRGDSMREEMRVCRADVEDLAVIAALGTLLWPNHTAGELEKEFSLEMKKGSSFFLVFSSNTPIGFAQCGLRYDYVEGTQSSPVGYLEGVFIKEAYRGKGYARALLKACEEWSAKMGCDEFASDCELANEKSRLFHLHTGFKEANRIICFTKKLENPIR